MALNMAVAKQRFADWEQAQMYCERLRTYVTANTAQQKKGKNVTPWAWLSLVVNQALSADSPDFAKYFCTPQMAEAFIRGCLERLEKSVATYETEFKNCLHEADDIDAAIDSAAGTSD